MLKLLLMLPLLFLLNFEIMAKINPIITKAGFISDYLNMFIKSLKISNNGDKVFISGSHGFVRIIDSKNGNLIDNIEQIVESIEPRSDKHDIKFFDISTDEKFMCTEDLEIWDINEKKVVKSLNNTDSLKFVSVIKYSPSGKYIVAIGKDDYFDEEMRINIWDAASGNLVGEVNNYSISDFCFGSSDDLFYFVGNQKVIGKYEIASGKFEVIFTTLNRREYVIAISEDEKYISLFDYGSGYIVIAVNEKKEIMKKNSIYSSMPIFSKDSKNLIYGDINSSLTGFSLKFMSLTTFKIEREVKVEHEMLHLNLSKDGNKILMGSEYHIEILDLVNNKSIPLICYSNPIKKIHFLPDNKNFITIDMNRYGSETLIQQVNIETNERKWIYFGESQGELYYDYFYPSKISTDGNLFVYASKNYYKNNKCNVLTFDTETGAVKNSLETDIKIITDFDFSIDSRYLYVLGQDSILQVWDLTNSTKIIEYKLPAKTIALKISKFSNEVLLFLGNDYSNVLYKLDLETKIIKYLQQFNSSLLFYHYPFAFSNDSRYFAAQANGYVIEIYDIENEKVIKELKYKNVLDIDDIKTMVFSYDNKQLICSREENHSLDFWDIEKGEMTNPIKDYLHPQINTERFKIDAPIITTLGFSPDGRYFAFGNDEPAVLIYDTQTLDIKEENNNYKIENCDVFPNPVRDRAEIKLNEFYLIQPAISIYNVFGGRQAVQAEFVSAGDTQKFIINNINLTPGFYIYTITGESNKQRGSFVVIK
jgi:WD40 repeat protein